MLLQLPKLLELKENRSVNLNLAVVIINNNLAGYAKRHKEADV